MQLKPVGSAAVALASVLQGIPCLLARAAGSGKGRFPHWLAHAHSSGPQRREVAKPGLTPSTPKDRTGWSRDCLASCS